ncbi:phosphorylase family protein, partial [Halomonas caseinilytica]|uniref:phosphorylase family protein n=1 Tax=Halomonas caseinilytica TaxID=438744 RepID=UPI000B00EE9D
WLGDVYTSQAYDAIAADMVDMESYACLRACMRFNVPLVVLRGISDGKAELNHVDDWTAYLHVIDEKLANPAERLNETIGHRPTLSSIRKTPSLVDFSGIT